MSFLVFDIETVPDTTVWSAANAPKKRGSNEDAFPPTYAHRPVAIGFLVLTDEYEFHQMGCVGTTTFGDDEGALITAWNGFVDSFRPTLVSFNGRSFDMQVLSMRAYVRGLPQGWYTADYRKKYSDQAHVDLMQELSNYDSFKGFGLSTMAQLIGLPGKLGFDGSMVAAAMAAGNAKQVEDYCLLDVVQTSFVFLRYALMRGRITVEQYKARAETLFGACNAHGMTALVQGSSRQRLLLE